MRASKVRTHAHLSKVMDVLSLSPPPYLPPPLPRAPRARGQFLIFVRSTHFYTHLELTFGKGVSNAHTHRKRPIPDIRERHRFFPLFFFGGVHIFQTLFLTLSFAGLSLLFFSFSSLSRLLFQLMSRKFFLIPRSRARTSQFRNLSRFPRLLQPCDFAFAFSGLRVVELHFVVLRGGGGGGGGGFLVGVFGFCNFFFV